jgi:ribosome biogenesis SPOUT family RNA methylase Rps3
MPYLIIEHLEEISDWLWLEYRHASEWWKDKLIFTNVLPEEREKLAKLGSVIGESVTRLPFDRSKIIVLDLQAEEGLKPEDIDDDTIIVVGGILGDAVPRGRTKEFITSKMEGVKVRHIGRPQYSIDGASIVAKLIADGKRLEEIEYEENPTIRLDEFSEITLHYAVPKLEGKLLLTPGLIELQKRNLGFTEEDEEISDEELIEFFEGKREL